MPGAGFAAVRDLLLTDPDRAVHGVDAYRVWLQDLVDEATEGLSGSQFDIPDALRRCDVGIPPVGTAAAPYYTPPSEDLAVPGRVWFPTLGKESFPMWADVTTAYHEAVPGHHLQFACTYMASLTRAQRLGFQPAYGEGWALYAERLMDELGWFHTPDTRLGFLSYQALRAVRVVVDIGLHLGRRVPAGLPGTGEPWTFDTAVACLRACGWPDRGVRPQRGAALLVVAGAGHVLQAGRANLAGRSGRGPGRGRGILRPARLARPRPGPRPARSRPPRAGARCGLSRAAPGPPSTSRPPVHFDSAEVVPASTSDAPGNRKRSSPDRRHRNGQRWPPDSHSWQPCAGGGITRVPRTCIPADQSRDVCRSRNTIAPRSTVGTRHAVRAQRESHGPCPHVAAPKTTPSATWCRPIRHVVAPATVEHLANADASSAGQPDADPVIEVLPYRAFGATQVPPS